MTTLKQEVLVFGEIRHAKKTLEEMKERYEFKEFDPSDDFKSVAIMKYENVVAILLAHGADQIIGKFDTETLESLSPAVNVIMVIGKASELVDIDVATGNGVFVADTFTDPQLTEEEMEQAALNNLEFALITGVPKDPVNKIEEVEEAAVSKAEGIVTSGGEINLDCSDIQIKI